MVKTEEDLFKYGKGEAESDTYDALGDIFASIDINRWVWVKNPLDVKVMHIFEPESIEENGQIMTIRFDIPMNDKDRGKMHNEFWQETIQTLRDEEEREERKRKRRIEKDRQIKNIEEKIREEEKELEVISETNSEIRKANKKAQDSSEYIEKTLGLGFIIAFIASILERPFSDNFIYNGLLAFLFIFIGFWSIFLPVKFIIFRQKEVEFEKEKKCREKIKELENEKENLSP